MITADVHTRAAATLTIVPKTVPQWHLVPPDSGQTR
jgi:hypothetical protein